MAAVHPAGWRLRSIFTATALVTAVLAGCSSVSPPPDPALAPQAEPQPAPPPTDAEISADATRYALDMVGTPYRYGGNTPEGFDCSGLVQYSYALAGVELPRTVEGLLVETRAIRKAKRRPGDLLIFHLDGRPNSHVGLYVGDGNFVHAPSTGKFVTTASLSNPYWRQRLAGTRRPVF